MGGVDWFDLAKERDRWLASVTVVMNNAGNFVRM